MRSGARVVFVLVSSAARSYRLYDLEVDVVGEEGHQLCLHHTVTSLPYDDAASIWYSALLVKVVCRGRSLSSGLSLHCW